MSSNDWHGYVDTTASHDDPYTAAARAYDLNPPAPTHALPEDFERLAIDHHILVNDLLDDDEDGYDDARKLRESDTNESRPSAFACAYCGISNTECVAQCVKTGKWFCNGRSNGLPGSCLVYHLVRSRNKEVRLHASSPLGDMLLECYVTGATNVFNLGFIPCKDENVVVLATRDSAQSNPAALKELNLDISLWEPLIQDKAFLPWLVKEPDETEIAHTRQVSTKKVQALEELWKTNPMATIDDVERQQGDEELQPVASTYDDAILYQNVFGPILRLEAEYDKAQRESQTKDDIAVRWDTGLNGRKIAFFRFGANEEIVSVALGDSLRLRLRYQTANGMEDWEGSGVVIKFTAQEEVGLEMYRSSVPSEYTNGYSVDFLWKGTSYERAQLALLSFASDETSCSGYIYHKLLGHQVDDHTLSVELPTKLNAPGLPTLNESQQDAVRKVLQRPLSLVQGPPGTGKTVTSATIVYHLAKRGNGQVIVCAPSNVAVDHLAEKIEKTGLKVVRISSRSREHLISSVEHLTLHYQVANVGGATHKIYQKLQQLKNEQGELSAGDEKQYRNALKKLEREVLENADVICTTAVGAGDPRLANFRFRMVLIDESTQATEPECLIPIVMGAKQVVMVGDHQQLGPVVTCKQAYAAGLGQSLFERLISLGNKPIQLQIQYRMHPSLAEFPSNKFYEGVLLNGVSAPDRTLSRVDFPWPVPSKPMMFWSQTGQEEMSASGTSFLNRAEAVAVEKCVTRLLNSGVSPDQIGVVTPYEGQRAYVVQHMTRVGVLHPQLYKDVQVASVDSFQGKEKDFIIMTCVRSNEKSGIGFLSDPRRLNVAITRARNGLIIVGNPKVLNRQSLFHELLTHFRMNNCLVDGTLDSLKECRVALPEPDFAVKDPWKRMNAKHHWRAGAEQHAMQEFPELGVAYGYGRFQNFRDIDSESEFGAAGSEFSYQPPSELDHGARPTHNKSYDF